MSDELNAKDLAEAEKFRAEARSFKAVARKETARAEQEEIALRSRQRQEKILLAQDELNHVYVFDDPVVDESVAKCIAFLGTWARQEPGCSIEIQITSPGGSIFAGLKLLDFVRDLRTRGHEVTTTAYGLAASMAAILLQAGDVRRMGENAFLLIHEGSMQSGGDWGRVQDDVALMGKLQDRILSILEERSTLSRRKIKDGWKRTDWYLNAEEALRAGFVDEVL